MDLGPIIVRSELNKDPAQVCLAEHDQVVDALPPDRADQSFRKAVLPWRTDRDRRRRFCRQIKPDEVFGTHSFAIRSNPICLFIGELFLQGDLSPLE